MFVRPAERIHVEVKVLYDPGGGIVSQMARVSTRDTPERGGKERERQTGRVAVDGSSGRV